MSKKRLRVFAGPNGSGKSSLFQDLNNRSVFPSDYFINADNIEKELKEKGFIDLFELGLQIDKETFQGYNKKSSIKKKAKKDGFVIDIKFKDNILVNLPKDTNSYEASFVATFIREEFIKAGISFSFETVMSHESKLQEIESANTADYKTYLYYICTETPIVNKSRIDNRVEKGGHSVSEDKINSRFNGSLRILPDAIKLVRRAYIFDNSGKEYRLLAEFFKGELAKIYENDFPKWFHVNVVQKLDF